MGQALDDGERIEELKAALRGLFNSFEYFAYVAQPKHPDDHDEYDEMMAPYWRQAYETYIGKKGNP